MSKKCTNCEAIVGEHYSHCPSCSKQDFKPYKPSENSAKENLSESMGTMVEFSPLDDYEIGDE